MKTMTVEQIIKFIKVDNTKRVYNVTITSKSQGFYLLYRDTEDKDLLIDCEVLNAFVNEVIVRDNGTIIIDCL